jgi:hypothetical protein
MKPSQPPALAGWLLVRLGAGSLDVESLQGDLIEQWGTRISADERGCLEGLGRSSAWYWRQVLTAIAVGSLHEINSHRLLALRAVVTGWAVLLLAFGLLGDRVADGLANTFWDWTREDAYRSHVWWPFWVSAVFMSYTGFAVSAWVVARLHRSHAMAMLLAYVVSMVAALAVAATVLWWLGPVPVPHSIPCFIWCR